MEKRNYAVAGGGYVGLATAVALSLSQHVVICDVDETKVNKINAKISPIKDKLIETYLSTRELDLIATTDADEAYKDADTVIIAVPTNYDVNTNYFDTSFVDSVIVTAHKINPDITFIIKSTIPIGYCADAIKRLGVKNISFSPEFLREGQALRDVLCPTRIVTGYDKLGEGGEETDKRMLKALADFRTDILWFMESCTRYDGVVPFIHMGTREAEAVKLFSNTYLATRVAFFNELDSYAVANGLNAKEIIQGVCADPRIGEGYNNPSFGYGGYCLPKDTKQLAANYADTDGVSTPETMMTAVVYSNVKRKQFIADEIIRKTCGLEDAKDKHTVGIYKLAMKSGSDNSRCSAVVDIMFDLLARDDIDVIVYDPSIAGPKFQELFPVINDFDTFANMSDVIVANRAEPELVRVSDKVFTRDIYGTD